MPMLSEQRCVACRADAPHVTDEELPDLRSQASDWDLLEELGVRKLCKTFRFSDFASALSFTVGVGGIAEEQGHHPVLITDWGKVTVTWWTHKIKGLHRNDFIMAAKTDQIYNSYQES